MTTRWNGRTLSAIVAVCLIATGGCTLNDRLTESVRDPVCGNVVEKKKAAALRDLLRKTYYFDSEECARTFDRHPARYYDVASGMYPEYDY
ncbi:MAG TPA: YHS domain-containing protein [Planctomycetota bacterium]|jgi:YHS domain-containing protein|nr:YHS domain-containing protein [Planctomycetota bacterium]